MDQSPRGFASEDEEATYCLSLLRDGDRHQQIVARERLSQIFERRGMLDEVAQCLESNIREGVRDPRVYQRLAGIYRRQGRHELSEEVMLEARRLADRLARAQQAGVRRPPPGRPLRPGPPPSPPPGPLEAPTAPLPAAAPGRPPGLPPGSGGELELDQVGAGARDLPAQQPPGAAATARPWWLSPAMLVLLILLCGPYGLALMWVRGDYTRRAKVRATAVWAGLVVLVTAAAAVVIQSQMGAIVAASARTGAIPSLGSAPTPIVFGTPSAAPGATKPALPPGLAVAPPTPAASPGAVGSGPSGVTIQPAPATTPAPAQPPSPTPASPPAAAKPDGERVKVVDTGGSGANLRERPGTAGSIIKTVPEGTVLTVVGPDQQIDGVPWRNVRDDAGATGWIAAELLEPA